jgi:hypothetical protein
MNRKIPAALIAVGVFTLLLGLWFFAVGGFLFLGIAQERLSWCTGGCAALGYPLALVFRVADLIAGVGIFIKSKLAWFIIVPISFGLLGGIAVGNTFLWVHLIILAILIWYRKLYGFKI